MLTVGLIINRVNANKNIFCEEFESGSSLFRSWSTSNVDVSTGRSALIMFESVLLALPVVSRATTRQRKLQNV